MVADTVSKEGTRLIARDAREALEGGTFDLSGHHLSRNLLVVNSEGWEELAWIFAWTLKEIRAVRTAEVGIEVEAALMLFGRN